MEYQERFLHAPKAPDLDFETGLRDLDCLENWICETVGRRRVETQGHSRDSRRPVAHRQNHGTRLRVL